MESNFNMVNHPEHYQGKKIVFLQTKLIKDYLNETI